MNRTKLLEMSELCFWVGALWNTVKGAIMFASGNNQHGALNVLLAVMCVVGIGFVSARRKEIGDG